MDLYALLLKSHSGWRYVVMLTLVIAILSSFAGWFGRKDFSSGNKKINLFALIAAHLQFVFGLVLYFFSPFVKANDMAVAMKDDSLRYWTVEHITAMLIAVALVTIGHSKSKRLSDSVAKHKTVAIFYTLAFAIIIITIVLSGRPVIGS